jgi:hypothetical protein
VKDELEAALRLALAPLHQRASDVAIGKGAGLTALLVTMASLLLDPAGRFDLSLLAQYFDGYCVSRIGALIGAGWAFVVGFVAGWVTAFVRDLVLATWLFFTLARADLGAARGFLDHI